MSQVSRWSNSTATILDELLGTPTETTASLICVEGQRIVVVADWISPVPPKEAVSDITQLVRAAFPRARVTTLAQLFPVNHKHVGATGPDGNIPFAQISLLEHYIRSAGIKDVVRADLIAGDVTGQWNLYIDWSRTQRRIALDELHDLATMDHKDSAAMAKVKLQAAIALRGGEQRSVGDREIDLALSELNQLYHQNAPRIKEIRQTVVKLEDGREATQRIIEVGPVDP